MTNSVKGITFLAVLSLSLLIQKTNAQGSVIDPRDPVVNYDPAHPPPIPPDDQITKWVRTPNTAVAERNPGWNIDVYKAYVFQKLSFRVEFPKSYNPDANDGKKYPVIIFLHGKGENAVSITVDPVNGRYDPSTGLNYDNEWQLLQGPHEFDTAIQNGTYDGYVIAPQTPDQWYKGLRLSPIMEVVKYMIIHNKVDPFHIVVNGLSDGGQATWDMLDMFPNYVSAAAPMSAPLDFVSGGVADSSYIANKRFTPIWTSQGGLDDRPTPAQTQRLADSMLKYGANFREVLYPGLDHHTWYAFWGERNFWPFVNNAYSSNPWMLGGLKNPWPGAPFRDTIGIAPPGNWDGHIFTGYRWRHDGSEIEGQTNNTLVVTSPGVYDALVQRDGIWSDISHVPIVIRPGFYEAEDYVSSNGTNITIQKFYTTDVGGGQGLGYITNGSYMDYAINPNVAGTFTLQLRVASEALGGVVQVMNSDGTVLARISVPQTGGWDTWVTTEPVNITLAAGPQYIRLQSVTDNGWDINWLQFGLAGSKSPLPVKFVYFNSQCSGGGVKLEWKTAQEFNSKSFDVQTSVDGISWTSVSTVVAAGQSSSERTYHYTDNGSGGSSFYRVVEKDQDGRSVVSSVVRSNCQSGRDEFMVSPNPVSNSAVMSIHLQQAATVQWKIIDGKGAMVQQNQMVLPSGSSSIPLNLSNYSKGIYTISIYYNNEMKTIKLIKK
jgi:predicted esterase